MDDKKVVKKKRKVSKKEKSKNEDTEDKKVVEEVVNEEVRRTRQLFEKGTLDMDLFTKHQIVAEVPLPKPAPPDDSEWGDNRPPNVHPRDVKRMTVAMANSFKPKEPDFLLRPISFFEPQPQWFDLHTVKGKVTFPNDPENPTTDPHKKKKKKKGKSTSHKDSGPDADAGPSRGKKKSTKDDDQN